MALIGYFRRTITISPSLIDATLSNFEIMVKLVAGNFDFTTCDWLGLSVQFATDDQGNNMLPFERIKHNSNNEEAVYFVKLTSVSDTVDTVFYIFYKKERGRYETLLEREQQHIESKSGVGGGANAAIQDGGNPFFGDVTWTWDRDIAAVTVLSNASWPSVSRHRMWYSALEDVAIDTNKYACYAFSSDGKSWTKPNIGRFTYGGNTNNNIIIGENYSALSAYYDEDTDIYYVLSGNKPDGGGGVEPAIQIWTSSSPDGPFALQKDLTGTGHTLTRNGMSIEKNHDGKWIIYTQHGVTVNLRRQDVFLSDTTDVTGSWTYLGLAINTATQLVSATNQRYLCGIQRHAGLYQGVVNRYDSTTEQLDLSFWASRNLRDNWQRRISPFVARGAGGTWNDEIVGPGGKMVQVGNTWFIFFSGSAEDHAAYPAINRETRMGIATIGFDRIQELNGTGNFITVSLEPDSGKQLFVNVDASGGGNLEVEVLDASDDSVLVGFAQADCDDITTDTFSTEVTWGGNSLPTGQRIKLKFYLTSATFYAYKIGSDSDILWDFSVGAKVWNDNVKAMIHMTDNTANSIQVNDSTPDSIDGIKKDADEPADAIGMLNEAQSFDDNDDYITLGNDLNSILSQKSWSVEFLIKNGTNGDFIVGNRDVTNLDEIRITVDNNSIAATYDDDSFGAVSAIGATVVNDGSWYHAVVTIDGSNLKLYINSNLEDTGDVSGAGILGLDDKTVLGARFLSGNPRAAGHSTYFSGLLEEVVISDVTLTLPWIKARYNNLFDNILAVGAEEAVLPSVLPLIIKLAFTGKQADIGGTVKKADITFTKVT